MPVLGVDRLDGDRQAGSFGVPGGQLSGPPPVLATAWTAGLGLAAPVLNAPMGGIAGGALAAAVSRAGGLGMIGVGSAGSTALLEREAARTRDEGLRFGIGLLDWALARDPGLLDSALATGPVLVSVSFGDDWRWADRVRAAGVIAVTQVATAAAALAAGIPRMARI